MKSILVAIFMTILMVSCDYECNEHYMIDNKSNHSIDIYFVEKNSTDTTKIIVSENETRDFYVNTTATAVSKNKGDNYLDVFDTIRISINDTLVLNKDLYNMENWDYWHQGNRSSKSKFTFTINESDLKPK